MNNDKRVLLKNVNYLDVESGCIKHNKDIFIQNNIIKRIDSKLDYLDCNQIDCKDLYAIPSYIDMHVHISFNSYIDGVFSFDNIIPNIYEAAQNGVCLLRDVGIKNYWTKQKILSSIQGFPVPKIVMSGSPICVENGHGIEYGEIVKESEISKWIYMHKCLGYEWVKIMNDPENHSESYLKHFVYEAHRYDLKVACHVFRNYGIELAIKSGCDTIEHVVPTNYTQTDVLNPYYVPTAYSAWSSCQKSYLKKLKEKDAHYLLEWLELLENNICSAIKHNTKILCGTDAGCCPSSFKDIVSEMMTLNYYGLNNLEVIRAATINAAECLGYNSLYGSISEGKFANIIILKNNPLTEIDALRFPQYIFLDGIKIRDEVSGPWN